jgi:hypothetical protein
MGVFCLGPFESALSPHGVCNRNYVTVHSFVQMLDVLLLLLFLSIPLNFSPLTMGDPPGVIRISSMASRSHITCNPMGSVGIFSERFPVSRSTLDTLSPTRMLQTHIYQRSISDSYTALLTHTSSPTPTPPSALLDVALLSEQAAETQAPASITLWRGRPRLKQSSSVASPSLSDNSAGLLSALSRAMSHLGLIASPHCAAHPNMLTSQPRPPLEPPVRCKTVNSPAGVAAAPLDPYSSVPSSNSMLQQIVSSSWAFGSEVSPDPSGRATFSPGLSSEASPLASHKQGNATLLPEAATTPRMSSVLGPCPPAPVNCCASKEQTSRSAPPQSAAAVAGGCFLWPSTHSGVPSEGNKEEGGVQAHSVCPDGPYSSAAPTRRCQPGVAVQSGDNFPTADNSSVSSTGLTQQSEMLAASRHSKSQSPQLQVVRMRQSIELKQCPQATIGLSPFTQAVQKLYEDERCTPVCSAVADHHNPTRAVPVALTFSTASVKVARESLDLKSNIHTSSCSRKRREDMWAAEKDIETGSGPPGWHPNDGEHACTSVVWSSKTALHGAIGAPSVAPGVAGSSTKDCSMVAAPSRLFSPGRLNGLPTRKEGCSNSGMHGSLTSTYESTSSECKQDLDTVLHRIPSPLQSARPSSVSKMLAWDAQPRGHEGRASPLSIAMSAACGSGLTASLAKAAGTNVEGGRS